MTDVEAATSGKVSLEDKKRQLGSQVYAAEMMNQPIDETSAEFFRKNFPRAECILDFWHAAEHLTELGLALWPEDEALRQQRRLYTKLFEEN